MQQQVTERAAAGKAQAGAVTAVQQKLQEENGMLLAPNKLGCGGYVRRDLRRSRGGVALRHARAASAGGGYCMSG